MRIKIMYVQTVEIGVRSVYEFIAGCRRDKFTVYSLMVQVSNIFFKNLVKRKK